MPTVIVATDADRLFEEIAAALDAADTSLIRVRSGREVRQAVKDFSNWPTVPQLYIKGEFIGGADIVTEMFQSGELQKLIPAEVTE